MTAAYTAPVMMIPVLTLTMLLAPAPAHSIEFWRGVVKQQYAPPADADLPALAIELTDMLASPDPEQRDAIAYATLASWIYQQRALEPATINQLADRLLANLKDHIGERDNDMVFRRSFSALVLSVIVARDNASPFFTAEQWRRIEAAALAYFAAEQDLRGYDPAQGWMHSAAHTADLIKFLARSRYVTADDQTRVLDAVGRKLAAAHVVFTFGEDERIARAVLSIVNRADFDRAAFTAWVTVPAPRLPARPTLEQLRAGQNRKNVLAKLEVLLSTDPQPSEGVQAARDALRTALKTMY